MCIYIYIYIDTHNTLDLPQLCFQCKIKHRHTSRERGVPPRGPTWAAQVHGWPCCRRFLVVCVRDNSFGLSDHWRFAIVWLNMWISTAGCLMWTWSLTGARSQVNDFFWGKFSYVTLGPWRNSIYSWPTFAHGDCHLLLSLEMGLPRMN